MSVVSETRKATVETISKQLEYVTCFAKTRHLCTMSINSFHRQWIALSIN